MVKRGRGHFIGVSSMADELLSVEAPSYHASKAVPALVLYGWLAWQIVRHGIAVGSGIAVGARSSRSLRPYGPRRDRGALS